MCRRGSEASPSRRAAAAVAQDLITVEGEAQNNHPPRECREHLAWAETFPAWVEENRAPLREAWERAASR